MRVNWWIIGILGLLLLVAYLLGRLHGRGRDNIPTDLIDLYKGVQDLPAKVLQVIQGSINPQKGRMAELLTYAELRYDYDRIIPLGQPVDFIGIKNNEVIDFNRIITPDNYESKIADVLNVQYVLSLSEIDSEKLHLVFEEGQTKVYENTEVLPRVYLVESVQTVKNVEDMLDKLFDESIDLQKTALVESNTIPIDNRPLSELEHVDITDYLPSRVTLQSKTEASRMIVLSDVYDENWRVFIDGTESTSYRVNYILRGVIVPEGSHTVEFSYSVFN